MFVYRPRESGDIRTNPGRGHMRNQRSASLRKLTVVSLARMGKRPLQNEIGLSRNNETASGDSVVGHRPQAAVETAEARVPTPEATRS